MIRFFQRPYRSANAALLLGPRPVLIDTGFGAADAELFAWLGQDVPALVLNTHAHSDHAGGNRAVQDRFGIPIAAPALDPADPGDARWLEQPIPPYRIDRTLAPGEVIDTGAARWTVLATPGHTPEHCSLYQPESGTLVLGDALHRADLGWLNPHRPDMLEATADTVARLAALPARTGYSGHGPAITDLPAAIASARRRLQSWQRDPAQIGWHACKRIFAHALILEDGLEEASIAPYLCRLPWFRDHAEIVFRTTPEALVGPLVTEMLRADAAYREDGKLFARAATRPQPSSLRKGE